MSTKLHPPDTHDSAVIPGTAQTQEDFPRLVYMAPYFTEAPLAEILEPAVIEAAKTILPPLVQPAADQAAAEAVAELAVMRVGDTMTGPLFLSPLIPTQDSQATTKHYVDSVWAADLSHALVDDLARDLPIYGSWGSVDNMQADATPVLNAYLAAGDVIIPPGRYRFDTQPNAITTAHSIRGMSPTGTVLVVNYATGDFLRIGDGAGNAPSNAQIEYLRIEAGVDRTSGAAIHAYPCHICSVRDVVIAPNVAGTLRHYNGIQIDGGTNQFGFGIIGFEISLCHGFGIGLRNYPLDVAITQGIVGNCGVGIDIESASGCYLTQGETLSCGVGVKVSPPNSGKAVNALFATNWLSDTAAGNCWEFSGFGSITDIHLTNSWGCGSTTGSGFFFNSPFINGLTLANCHAHGSHLHGVQVNNGKNIAINGSQIGMNSRGGAQAGNEIAVGAGVTDIVIANNIVGAAGYFAANGATIQAAFGIAIEAGAGDRIIVTGNKVDDFLLAPGDCKATGANVVIRDNTGWRTSFSGIQVITSGTSSVTFPHYLDVGDPTKIMLLLAAVGDPVVSGINRFWAGTVATGLGGTVTVRADKASTGDFYFWFRAAAYE